MPDLIPEDPESSTPVDAGADDESRLAIEGSLLVETDAPEVVA